MILFLTGIIILFLFICFLKEFSPLWVWCFGEDCDLLNCFVVLRPLVFDKSESVYYLGVRRGLYFKVTFFLPLMLRLVCWSISPDLFFRELFGHIFSFNVLVKVAMFVGVCVASVCLTNTVWMAISSFVIYCWHLSLIDPFKFSI